MHKSVERLQSWYDAEVVAFRVCRRVGDFMYVDPAVFDAAESSSSEEEAASEEEEDNQVNYWGTVRAHAGQGTDSMSAHDCLEHCTAAELPQRHGPSKSTTFDQQCVLEVTASASNKLCCNHRLCCRLTCQHTPGRAGALVAFPRAAAWA